MADIHLDIDNVNNYLGSKQTDHILYDPKEKYLGFYFRMQHGLLF